SDWNLESRVFRVNPYTEAELACSGPFRVRPAIMRSERMLRDIVPPVFAQRTLFRVQRIVDAIVRSARLADDEQTNVLVRIVDEGVADPGTGRETDTVPWHQPVEMAVDPGVRVALDYVDELLLCALGMRV